MQSKKKILLTGGNSLIGQDLVKYLLKKYIVISTFRKKKISIKHENLRQINYDFKKKLNLNEKVDHLIHLASLTPTNSKIDKNLLSINKLGIKKLFNKKFEYKSIILISTLAVYGKIKNKIVNENQKPNKPNYYGKSKIQMENFLKKFAKEQSISYLILRLPSVLGNFRSKTTFMNRVFEKLYNNKKLSYINPNSLTNNIIHTETLAKIIDTFFQYNKPKNKTLNLCSKNKEKLKDLIKLIKTKFKSKSDVVHTIDNKSFSISTKKIISNKLKIIETKKTILKTINFYLKK